MPKRADQQARTIERPICMDEWKIAHREDRFHGPEAANAERLQYGELVGRSEAFRALVYKLKQLERSLAPVLIQGESGTGKELVARAIHQHSAVARGPFVAVNCGALDAALFKSELFGHQKGAFTGALCQNLGAFAAADGGTLFLDEVGEMPASVQPGLLRVLEQRVVHAVGSHRERPVDARVLFATNRDLPTEVRQGRFREDLMYRIQVIEVRVPPLRDRPDDIAMLAQACGEQLGLPPLPPALLGSFATRPWPGNVRELRNAIESFGVLGSLPPARTDCGEAVERALLHQALLSGKYAQQKSAFLAIFTKVYFGKLLEETGGNISEASRRSGVDRTYLGKMATKLGIAHPSRR